jgi:hypothetical protein
VSRFFHDWVKQRPPPRKKLRDIVIAVQRMLTVMLKMGDREVRIEFCSFCLSDLYG